MISGPKKRLGIGGIFFLSSFIVLVVLPVLAGLLLLAAVSPESFEAVNFTRVFFMTAITGALALTFAQSCVFVASAGAVSRADKPFLKRLSMMTACACLSPLILAAAFIITPVYSGVLFIVFPLMITMAFVAPGLSDDALAALPEGGAGGAGIYFARYIFLVDIGGVIAAQNFVPPKGGAVDICFLLAAMSVIRALAFRSIGASYRTAAAPPDNPGRVSREAWLKVGRNLLRWSFVILTILPVGLGLLVSLRFGKLTQGLPPEESFFIAAGWGALTLGLMTGAVFALAFRDNYFSSSRPGDDETFLENVKKLSRTVWMCPALALVFMLVEMLPPKFEMQYFWGSCAFMTKFYNFLKSSTGYCLADYNAFFLLITLAFMAFFWFRSVCESRRALEFFSGGGALALRIYAAAYVFPPVIAGLALVQAGAGFYEKIIVFRHLGWIFVILSAILACLFRGVQRDCVPVRTDNGAKPGIGMGRRRRPALIWVSSFALNCWIWLPFFGFVMMLFLTALGMALPICMPVRIGGLGKP